MQISQTVREVIEKGPLAHLTTLSPWLQYDARNAGIRGDLRHCASDRGRRSAPSATLGPDLSRVGGGISAGLDAEHSGLCHQNCPDTVLGDWSVGSTSRWQ
jgi:hypothetical protein